MKIFSAILLFAVLIACFPSCTKTTTYEKYDTLTVYPSKDASIFIQDNATPLYGDNGSGGSDLLEVGYMNDNKCFARTLLAFDLSSLPSNATILNASISFTMGKSGDNLHPVSIYKVTQSWTEGTTDDLCEYTNHHYCINPGATIVGNSGDVTWNSASNGGAAWTTAGGSFVATASATNVSGGMPSFNSSGLVSDIKSWVAAPSSNNGWLLKVDESALTKNGGERVRYLSKEASTMKASRTKGLTTGADPSTRPTLRIIYHK